MQTDCGAAVLDPTDDYPHFAGGSMQLQRTKTFLVFAFRLAVCIPQIK
jgi:hypothetical protein